MKKFNKVISIPYIVFLFILVVIPTFIIFVQSFLHNETLSLTNFLEVILTPGYIKSFVFSTLYAFFVTMGCIIVGYPIALILWQLKRKWQYILLSIIMMQMWVNLVARTRAIQFTLKIINLDNTYWGAVFAGVYIFIPFLIFTVLTQLNKINSNLVEASLDLGASPLVTLQKIILPLSFPGLLSGIALVFLPAATTVVIPFLINGSWTIGNVIEALSTGTNQPVASAIAVLIIIFLIIFILLIGKINHKYEIENNYD